MAKRSFVGTCALIVACCVAALAPTFLMLKSETREVSREGEIALTLGPTVELMVACLVWAAPLGVLLGTLAAMATSTVGYWVGSSAGSAQKTDLLYRSAPSEPGAPK